MRFERTPDQVRALLVAADDLVEVVRRVPPPGWLPKGHGDALSAELVTMATRSLTSSTLLIFETFESERDHTEEAATLTRKLLEIFALMVWIAERGPSADVQALMIELADAHDLLKGARDVAIAYGSGAEDPRLKNLEQQVGAIEEALKSEGAPVKERESTFDILKKVDIDYAIRWRYKSYVVHVGVVGRALQRKDLALGAPADMERRVNVLSLGISLLGSIAERAISVLARVSDSPHSESLKVSEEELGRLAGQHLKLIEDAHAEIGSVRPTREK